MRIPNVRGIRRLIPLLAFGAITGCADATTSLHAEDPLLAALEARGFPAELAVDAGDTYLVDGDIVVRKADLRVQPRPGALQPRLQYQTNTVPYGAEYTVNLTAIAGNAAWLQAARGALAAWSSIPGSSIRLTETTGTANITIRFGTCSGAGSNTYGCADFPSQYTSCWPSACYAPGPYVTLHTGFTGTLSTDERRMAVAHELGHTLGFRHTDWNNRVCSTGRCSEGTGSTGAVHIPGTPTSATNGGVSDAGSVMNAILPSGIAGFSYYDRVAGRHLWPYGPGPANDAVLENGNPRISWQPVGDAAYYEVFFSQAESCGLFCYGPAPYTTTYVGSTTSTTYLDTSRTFGNIGCYMWATDAGYQVRVVFTDGKQSSLGYWSAYNGGGTCFY
jgi:hypothetical protein